MEEATPAPETGGNTFGTWANQFHARVPEPRPDEPRAASNSSMSISSATNESAVGSVSEPDSPDIRAQMSPLSDDGKQGWGSFLGKADGLDFSGIMNRVGHMDPAIDQMIKSELEADTREAETSAASAAPPAQRSGSSNSNMSLDEDGSVDLQSFVGPPESADSQDGYRRDSYREPPLPPRPPRDEPDRGGRSDAEPRGGRHPSDEERRRRERERDRDRDRGRRERSRHDDERSRHGDEDRHRRDRDRDRDRDRERDRDRDRDRDRRDRDRGDDHEEQRGRVRHHQRRDRDDDDTSGHRGRSGGHSHGGRGYGRDDDRGGGGGGGSGSGQRYHGYGTGRERPAGVEGEVVDGVAAEVVVVESGKEAETVAVTVKTESPGVGKVGASGEGERSVKKDISRERKETSKERDRKGTSREKDRKRNSSGSRRRESSSHKSSRRRDRSPERRSSKKTSSSSEKHSDKSRKPVSSAESSLESKSGTSASNERISEAAPKTKIDSSNSSPSHSTKSSSEPSSRKSEASNYKYRQGDSNNKLSKTAVVSIERLSEDMLKEKRLWKSSSASKPDVSSSTKSEKSESKASSLTKPEQSKSKTESDSKTPLSAKDRMAQLMEKYAPYLKDRFHRPEHSSRPKPKAKPKPPPPQNTYLGERKRPVSPSSHSSMHCLRQVLDEPDTLSVSSVDTADLSDFDDRLELELDLTEPERETLLRIGWHPVVDDLANVDDYVLASAAEDLVEVVDLCDEVESVDSGFNRSDASSSISAGSGAPKSAAVASVEPPLIDLEPAPPTGRRRRQRKVDYIALNSGLDSEDKAAEPTRRRRRPPRDDGDWSPAAKASRVAVSPDAEFVPRLSLKRVPEGKVRGALDREEWHVSSDKENMDGMTRLRDPGAAGDSVRIRPNLII